MINRDEAYALLKKYIKDEKIIKHSLAVEAIMQELAKKLGKDEEIWGVTGLIHDLDYEYTMREPEKHANVAAMILEGLVSEEVITAIKAHNYKHTDCVPVTTLDKALIAADAISGLVIATALVVPSKKLADVKIETLMNKFNDSSFARGCDRNRIELCLDTGLELQAFLVLSLNALKKIADPLGL